MTNHQQPVPSDRAIEKAYSEGILGNGIQTFSKVRLMDRSRSHHSGRIDRTKRSEYMRNALVDGLRRIMELRQNQFLTDALVRVAAGNGQHKHTLCAPHLPSVYSNTVPPVQSSVSVQQSRGKQSHPSSFDTKRTLKWHVFQKTQISLAEALEHVVYKCYAFQISCTPSTHAASVKCSLSHPNSSCQSRGAILPFTVSTKGQHHNHANMIYIDFQYRLIRCYLFEPNGARFSKHHSDGWHRLQQAWTWVRHKFVSMRKAFGQGKSIPELEPTIRVVGSRMEPAIPDGTVGIQTLLGTKTVRRKRTITGSTWTVQHRRGLGVCGAVTFWLFVTWLWAGKSRSIEQHYVQLHRYIARYPDSARCHLMEFIEGVNTAMVEKYSSYTRRFVMADIHALVKRIRHMYLDTKKTSIQAELTLNFRTFTGHELLNMKGIIVDL